MFNFVFNKVWLYLLLAAFVASFLYRVYKAGKDAEKLDQLGREIDAVVRRNKIEDDVDRLSDSAVLERLRKHGWFKDSD